MVDWSALRANHSPELAHIIKGFLAIEHVVPEYSFRPMELIRDKWARSRFHLLWSAEEAKHSNIWENVLLFGRMMSKERIEEYRHALDHEQSWAMPFDSPTTFVYYPPFQERATFLNYTNLKAIVDGKGLKSEHVSPLVLENDVDPILSQVSAIIARDEVAHYEFYRGVAALHLHFFPAEGCEALAFMLRNFTMPSEDRIPNRAAFEEAIVRTGVYQPVKFKQDVFDGVLKQLGFEGMKAFLRGIRNARKAPDEEGKERHTAIFEDRQWDLSILRNRVKGIYEKSLIPYATRMKRMELDPIEFPQDVYTFQDAE
jgi:acyl-[acyl-carrier-protein] desaturase